MQRAEWSSEHDFTVDGLAYRAMVGRSQDEQMVILKPTEAITAYERLLDALQPRNILELGIYNGGSTALLAQLAEPQKLVAIDICTECPPLERFLDARRLREVVVPHYGVDQADVDRLEQIVSSEFDAPLDLVIDDASHLVGPTRASFNQLFPHVRPGGLYVIEDWGWAHCFEAQDAPHQGVNPLSAIVFELLVVAARRPRMIADLAIDHLAVTIRRGDANLRPGRFDLRTQLDDVGRDMAAHLATARSSTRRRGAARPKPPAEA